MSEGKCPGGTCPVVFCPVTEIVILRSYAQNISFM